MRALVTVAIVAACAAPEEVVERQGQGWSESDASDPDCSEGLCELLVGECEYLGLKVCEAVGQTCAENRCKACAIASEASDQLGALCHAAACTPGDGVCVGL